MILPESIAACAERVLFADTLEEKLRLARIIEPEEWPASPDKRLAAAGFEPGRPDGLRLRPPGSRDRAKFPALARLGDDDEARGRLFHFFANHELLAAELMALALLRFPDAPAAFRRGLYETMREEQLHTRWYLDRMDECGVSFGSHPLSRFFWDSVAPMESPLDYVTRLSLTFEQANLDYTRHYAAALREAGDVTSARLMERIYRDEIQHVGYGLRWFREWKCATQSDWDAYRGALRFPLSPSRAKGNCGAFNDAGRREAGLDAEFVRELALFERSKGRVPRVFWFNPDAEDAIAAGPGYQATRGVKRFVSDLEGLALFLARRDDIVLLRQAPRREHLERLKREGFDLPEIEIVDTETALAAGSLTRERKLHELRPWAWEPRAETLFAPLRKNLPPAQLPLVWADPICALFSKHAQMARWPWWEGDPGSPWRSHACATEAEIAAARAAIAADFDGRVVSVAKAAFSAAGRGLIFDETGSDRRSDPVASAIVPCSIEPWATRVFDFSVQFEMQTGAGLRRLGFLRQIVDGRGRYRGTRWSPKFCAGLDPELARFLMETALPRYEPGAPFVVSLEAWLRESGHAGPVGVDAFIFRDLDGALRHRIVCEINPRHTMGRLTWELARRVAPGRAIRFEILKKTADAPPGALALTDPDSARDWVAWLTIE